MKEQLPDLTLKEPDKLDLILQEVRQLRQAMCVIESRVRAVNMEDRLSTLEISTNDNMHRLNDMMKELKGFIAMVRGNAQKNDWYKPEMTVQATTVTDVSTPIKLTRTTRVEEVNGKQEVRTSNGITFKEV